MAVRLRYLAHDLEVPIGQFIIGRSHECQLSLDDPLVSRKHALLVVDEQGATVEDLGSRNGVLLNGQKIDGSVSLSDGDKITIGAQQIVIGCSADTAPSSTKRVDTRMRLPTLGGPLEAAAAIRSSAIIDDESEATYATSQSHLLAELGRVPDRRVSALTLIGGVADKALAMGRADEAERLLQRSLTDIQERARFGVVDPVVAERAAQYAARLADGTSRGSWIDYIFELYTALGTLLPAHVVDELYEVVRKVKIDRAILRTYTDLLRERSPEYGPGERFIQHRIEGLERLGALK